MVAALSDYKPNLGNVSARTTHCVRRTTYAVSRVSRTNDQAYDRLRLLSPARDPERSGGSQSHITGYPTPKSGDPWDVRIKEVGRKS